MKAPPSALLAAAIVIFVLLCLSPILYMAAASFLGPTGDFTLDNYRRLAFETRELGLLGNSALLGTGAAVLATAVGGPLGLLLARVRLPARRFLRVGLAVPLVIPPYILALCWSYLGLPSSLTYSLAGAVVVLGAGHYPISMLATEAAARRVDGRLEEAALMVAGTGRVLRRITLPLIGPSIGAAALIVFVLAISEFGVPGLLRVNVFTTEVFTAFASLYDFGAATALAVPLLVIALAAAVLMMRVVGERLLAARRSGHMGLVIEPGRWRIAAVLGAILILGAFVMTPLALLLSEAGGIGRVITVVEESSDALVRSIWYSGLSAAVAVVTGVLLGYAGARSNGATRRAVHLALIMAFAVPSTVVGVGLIGIWNRPGVFGEVYASPLIVLLGYTARFVPIAALILSASLSQAPRSFEEAAEVAGAGWPRILARISLPQIRTGLAAAWVVTFIFCFGEIGTTILVAPPGESTLPVRVYTFIANAPSSEVAALSLMQAAMVIAPLAVFGLLARPRAKEPR